MWNRDELLPSLRDWRPPEPRRPRFDLLGWALMAIGLTIIAVAVLS